MLLRGCLIVGGNYKTIIIVFRSPQIIDRPNASSSSSPTIHCRWKWYGNETLPWCFTPSLPHLLLDCVPRRPSCTAPPSPRHSILALLQHFFPRLKSLVHSFIRSFGLSLLLAHRLLTTNASSVNDKLSPSSSLCDYQERRRVCSRGRKWWKVAEKGFLPRLTEWMCCN